MTDRLVIICGALVVLIIGGAIWRVHDDLVEFATFAPSEHEPTGELICEDVPGKPYLDELEEMYADGTTTSTGTVYRMMKHEPWTEFPCEAKDPGSAG